VREIRTLRAMWRALETEPYGVTAPVLDPTRQVSRNYWATVRSCHKINRTV
jgi:hypothetical protein